MAAERKQSLGQKLLNKDTWIKIEKVNDGGIFLFGAVLVATGVPALIALGGGAAIYSGVQYAAVDRATKNTKK